MPEGVAWLYWGVGLIGELILIGSIVVFGLGCLGAWRQTGDHLAKRASIVAFIYAAERVVWAITDVSYAIALARAQATGDLAGLAFPALLGGIAALLAGVTTGVILAGYLTRYFSRQGTKLGTIGGLLVVIPTALAILANVLSLWMWPYPLRTAFALLMCLHSVGIALLSLAFYQEGTPASKDK